MPFPFLKLPLELRNKIYAFSLCNYEEIEASLRLPDPNPSPQPVQTLVLRHYKKAGKIRTQDLVYPSRFTALLRVNRMVYEEALPIFYAGNTFGFSDPKDFYLFTCSLVKHRRDLVKSIRLPPGYNVIGDRTVWDTTQAMKGLESVSVVVPTRFWDTWGPGKPASESLYRALRDGVVLTVKLVTYSTGSGEEIVTYFTESGEERVVQEWCCRKGVAGWTKKIEDEIEAV